jgi:hypothetical protein
MNLRCSISSRWVCLLVLASSIGCSEPEPKAGEKFECLLEGAFWKSQVRGISTSTGGDPVWTRVRFRETDLSVSIHATKEGSNTSEAISIELSSNDKTALIFDLVKTSGAVRYQKDSGRMFELDRTAPAQLSFTRLDTSFVEGTFEFTLVDSEGHKLEITQGIFSLKEDTHK